MAKLFKPVTSELATDYALFPAKERFTVKIKEAKFKSGKKKQEDGTEFYWGQLALTLVTTDEEICEAMQRKEAQVSHNVRLSFSQEEENYASFSAQNNPQFACLLKEFDLIGPEADEELLFGIDEDDLSEKDNGQELFNEEYFKNVCNAIKGKEIDLQTIHETHYKDKDRQQVAVKQFYFEKN